MYFLHSTSISSPVWVYLFTNSHNDQLPVALIAQLVEHCTGITEAMGSIPVQAWIFFRLCFEWMDSLYLNTIHFKAKKLVG